MKQSGKKSYRSIVQKVQNLMVLLDVDEHAIVQNVDVRDDAMDGSMMAGWIFFILATMVCWCTLNRIWLCQI